MAMGTETLLTLARAKAMLSPLTLHNPTAFGAPRPSSMDATRAFAFSPPAEPQAPAPSS
jgi:hypothetical protein